MQEPSTRLPPEENGEIFIDNARSILKHYQLVQMELWDIADLKVGSVILGISSFRGKYMLPVF